MVVYLNSNGYMCNDDDVVMIRLWMSDVFQWPVYDNVTVLVKTGHYTQINCSVWA